MKMKKLFSTAILSSLFFVDVPAQTFVGQVADAASSPVGYATVTLLSESDSVSLRGCVADQDGRFSLSVAERREYQLQISCLGYVTVTLKSPPADLGTIVLEPDETLLGEVVVEGRIPAYRAIDGGICAHVANTLLGRTGTAADAIAHLPGIRKRPDGRFEVVGKGEPLLYIGNRRIRDLSELERLPSDAILRIELITNPGAEYDASVGAVVRIETAGNDRDGFALDLSSSVEFARRTGTAQQMEWSCRHRGLELSGALRYDLSRAEERAETEITTLAGNAVWWQRALSVDRSERQHLFGRVGLDYEANPRHSFGVMYDITHLPASSVENGTRTDVRVDSTPFDVWTTYGTSGERSRPGHHVNAYWTGAFGRLSVEVNADMLTGRSRGRESVSEYSANGEDAALDTEEWTGNRLYAGKILLSRPIGGGRLSGGSEYTHIGRDAGSTGYAGTIAGSDDRIADRNLALFLGYDGTFGRFGVHAGVRYEHVIYDFYEEGVFCRDESKRYDNLFPMLSLHASVREVRLSLDWRIRTERPAYGMLQRAVHYGNRLTYLSGTPDLQPTYIQSVELGGQCRNLQLSLGFHNYKDDILFVAEPLEPGSEISVNRFRNVNRRSELLFSAHFAPVFGRWRPEWMATGHTQWLAVPCQGGRRDLNGTRCHLRWSNAFLLPAGFLLRIDGCWDTPGYDRNRRLKSSSSVDVSLNRDFACGKWNIMLEANDLFHTVREASWQYDLQNIEYRVAKSDSRRVKCTVRYKFNDRKSRYGGTGAGTDGMRRL